MAYKIVYSNGIVDGEVEQPDAHSTLQQIMYLRRDGFNLITIIDPTGSEITHD